MHYDELLTRYVGTFGKSQLISVLMVSVVSIYLSFLNVGIVLYAYTPSHHCKIPTRLTKNGINTRYRLSRLLETLLWYDTLGLNETALLDLFIPVEGSPNGIGEEQSKCKIRSFPQDGNYTLEEFYVMKDKAEIVDCDQWQYDQTYFWRTMITQWNLVCGQEAVVATASSVFYAGFMVGLMVFGYAADRFGRRPVLLVTTGLSLLTGLAEALSPNILFFIIVRFFVAATLVSAYTTGYIICIEIVGEKWRPHCGTWMNFMWSFGYAIFPLLAMLARDWYTLHIVAVLPFFLLVSYYWIIDESPRWLYSRGSNDDADKIVIKMAVRNKTVHTLPTEWKVSSATNDTEKNEPLFKQFGQIFLKPCVLLRLLIFYAMWFVTAMVYYGLSLSSSDLEGSPFTNFMLMGAVELPGYFIATVGSAFWGRKPITTIAFLFSGLFLGGVVVIQALTNNLGTLIRVLVIGGKLSATTVFGAIYIWTAEVFPTTVRSVSFCSCSTVARIGSFLAPYIGLLKKINILIPQILFASLSLICSLLCLILPETRGKELPDSLEDAENFGKSATGRKVEMVELEKEDEEVID